MNYLQALAAAAALAVTLQGATFTDTFSQASPSARTFGSATVADGTLKLASAAGQTGSYVIDDFTGGSLVGGFNVQFRFLATPGGEGFALSFAPDINDQVYDERGGGTGFIISFLGSDAGAGGTVVVHQNGEELARYPAAFQLNALIPVNVTVRADGALDLSINNQPVVTDLFTYTPLPGRFALSARSGAEGGVYAIDDLSIASSDVTGTFVNIASPTGLNASPTAVVVVELQDFDASVNTNSIQFTFNGQLAAPLIVREQPATTITYDPPGALAGGSVNTVQVTYTTDSPTPVTKTVRFAFTVGAFNVLPSSFTLQGVDETQSGFQIRVVQAPAQPTLPNTLTRAEAQLAGTLTNEAGDLYGNEANLAGAVNGVFIEPGVINYAESGAPGNFSNDKSIPGIPGATGHVNNFAMEVYTWLYLKAGNYRMGVNSDDGFRLQAGLNARDVISLVLGEFEGSRTSGDTLFDLGVQQDGYYSFRLVWYQGDGPANLEWYSVNQTTGERVLINDPTHPNAIKAFRSGPELPYLSYAFPGPGSIVQTNASVELRLRGTVPAINAASINLLVDNQPVNATITAGSVPGESIIRYTPAAPFVAGTLHTIVARFADVNARNYTAAYAFTIESGERPELHVAALPNGSVSVTWNGLGALQESADLNSGIWTAVQGAAAGSYTTPATGRMRFFRLVP